MVGSSPYQQESLGSQGQDDFLNLERKQDWEGSVHTTHTSKSHSRVGSHVSQEQNNKAMQREIDHLKKELRHAWWRRTPSRFDSSSDDEKDGSYRRRSRTPPSESFSYEEEHHRERRYKSPTRKGLENNAMSKALNQISKSTSRTGLKEQFFLGVSISQCSPSTMDERTRWSMWAISVREWLSILRTKPWCARCSHLVWDPWWWDGSTA